MVRNAIDSRNVWSAANRLAMGTLSVLFPDLSDSEEINRLFSLGCRNEFIPFAELLQFYLEVFEHYFANIIGGSYFLRRRNPMLFSYPNKKIVKSLKDVRPISILFPLSEFLEIIVAFTSFSFRYSAFNSVWV